MKPILLITLAAATTLASSQAAVIFSESFGTVSANTAIAAHEAADGFDNDGFLFSGTGDIRSTTPSTYEGASGSANLYLTNSGTPTLIISGIDASGYDAGSLSLSFGAYKSTTASNLTELAVSWSIDDGTTWNALSFAPQPTGSGTSNWRIITVTNADTITNSSTLSLRFQNTTPGGTGTPNFRVDDVVLSSVPEPSTALFGGLGLLALLRRRRA